MHAIHSLKVKFRPKGRQQSLRCLMKNGALMVFTSEARDRSWPRSTSQNRLNGRAEEAVRIMMAWAGDDPNRQGLKDTPSRVARAYKEWFEGYDEDLEAMLKRTFDETARGLISP